MSSSEDEKYNYFQRPPLRLPPSLDKCRCDSETFAPNIYEILFFTRFSDPELSITDQAR